MDPGGPWHRRAKQVFLRFWRSKNPRVVIVRDVLLAGGFVLMLLLGVWVYSGQPFPSQAPLVVVESGSMMHGEHGPCLNGLDCAPYDDPFFGRVGTIDPGDLVLVRGVNGFDEVETAFGSGSRGGYGGHGDVIVFRRDGSDAGTPVIHRAMLLILAEPEGCRPNDSQEPCRYIIPETCRPDRFEAFVRPTPAMSNWRAYCAGSPEAITLDLERGGLFLHLDGYPCGTSLCPPLHSGFITKGDNNNAQDQPFRHGGGGGTTACCPVQVDWIVGKARGEIPWFGMIKLSINGNRDTYGEGHVDPTRSSQWGFRNVRAPWDIWVSLVVAAGILVVAPMGVDYGLGRLRRARAARRLRDESSRPGDEPRTPDGEAAEPGDVADAPTDRTD